MFQNTTQLKADLIDTNAKISNLQAELKKKDKVIQEYVDSLEKERRDATRANERYAYETSLLNERMETTITKKVDERIKAQMEKLNESLKTAAVNAKEVEMYKGAFREMGLDVKGIKEITMKLVEAVGNRADVHIVK